MRSVKVKVLLRMAIRYEQLGYETDELYMTTDTKHPLRGSIFLTCKRARYLKEDISLPTEMIELEPISEIIAEGFR